MAFDLAAVPIIDNHCHPPHRDQPGSEEAYRGYFTESRDPRITSQHVEHTLFYRESLGFLASLLGEPGDADPQALLDRRGQLSLRDLLALIVKKANIRGLVMDFGFQVEESCTIDEMAALLDGSRCQVKYVLRLETLIERLILQSGTFDEMVDQYSTELRGLRKRGVAALKSIIAYRSGLAIHATAPREAAEAFDRAKRQTIRSGGNLRLASKPLLDFLILLALEEAAKQRVPVQIHTALGDTDVDLLEANPLRLRPVLEDQAFNDAPIVLLHCYPYLREAAYLSAMYGNVYFDLSMTVPLLSHTSTRALEDVLGMAPASKLLYGSDAPGLPDYLWFGAVAWRRALGRLLGEWMVRDGLARPVAERVARQILHDNASDLYGFSP